MTSPLEFPERMTLEEYYAFEETTEARHEYVDGFVYAMTGGTSRHGVIVVNIAASLWNALQGGRCRVFASERKVRVARNVYVPDVMVVCDLAAAEAEAESAPRVIVEVTSRSTERIDRGSKRESYLTLPSLEHYLIVSQFEARVDDYRRAADGTWQHLAFVGTDGISLDSLGVSLSLSVIYQGIEFPPPRPQRVKEGDAPEWDDEVEGAYSS